MPISQAEKVRAIEEERVRLSVREEPQASPQEKKLKRIYIWRFIVCGVFMSMAIYFPITFMIVLAFPHRDIHPLLTWVPIFIIGYGIIWAWFRMLRNNHTNQ
jgi:hypothetical protein